MPLLGSMKLYRIEMTTFLQDWSKNQVITVYTGCANFVQTQINLHTSYFSEFIVCPYNIVQIKIYKSAQSSIFFAFKMKTLSSN